MIVLTIDQRRSRSSDDKVEALVKQANATVPVVRPFQRTAGDEIQAVMDDASEAIRLAVMMAASGDWSVGIGFGQVETPLPTETRAGRGPAFEFARVAVERAKNTNAHLAVHGPTNEASRLEAELQLTAAVVSKRRATAWEAGTLADEGMTQQQIAVRLGITQQAVSSRLSAALWFEANRMMDEAAKSLARQLKLIGE
ncbi:sigma factor-like helix-turn-helix DNA-binding protein [Glutamicibacter protophormiae]|uniref:sigma factor-like helix-turn-helix DNA-binding protein n=1 Tax=Glutamicibacter protophormiae TaxID=37930 RepID=UPI002A8199BF|nr:sigma factor-like helix-turn-helix DNA-binding protein [Glutamicibacter protophormiae]WPR66366.1 sigma factor-like helix-turn-helix DNA-binding protein [Glutamicibacter protophormiae]WPR69861.1 sigma factor-like helix-turn-helix DNA-binding protein [Glutamicibacter protophormiae]